MLQWQDSYRFVDTDNADNLTGFFILLRYQGDVSIGQAPNGNN